MAEPNYPPRRLCWHCCWMKEKAELLACLRVKAILLVVVLKNEINQPPDEKLAAKPVGMERE